MFFRSRSPKTVANAHLVEFSDNGENIGNVYEINLKTMEIETSGFFVCFLGFSFCFVFF